MAEFNPGESADLNEAVRDRLAALSGEERLPATAVGGQFELAESLGDIADPQDGVVYLVPEEPVSSPSISDVVSIAAGTPRADVQQALNDNTGRIIRFLSGTHRVGPLDVPEGVVVEIMPLAVLMWDLTHLPSNENGILNVRGADSSNLVRNVLIELLGEIDGDETGMPSGLPQRLEGMEIDLALDVMVRGDGIVRNMREDGIDIDASRNIKVFGVQAINNNGWGVHWGGASADQIGDQYGLCQGVTAIGNGFGGSDRGGIDINPEWGRVSLIGCVSKDNRKNYEIREPRSGVNSGRIISGCQSIDTGDVVAADDDFQWTDYAQVNDRLFLGGTEITAS